MSPSGQLAAQVLKLLAEGRIVPVADQMRLRYLAPYEERTLPIQEIARRILDRENEPPMKSKAAEQG